MGNTLTVGESGWRVWGGESGGVESGADSLGAWSPGMESLELESLGWGIWRRRPLWCMGTVTTLLPWIYDHFCITGVAGAKRCSTFSPTISRAA